MPLSGIESWLNNVFHITHIVLKYPEWYLHYVTLNVLDAMYVISIMDNKKARINLE
jgi:hypothetical protein